MECSICYENIEENNDCTITKCGHRFHSTCIIKHITIGGTFCPYCRCCLETGKCQQINDNIINIDEGAIIDEFDSLPGLISDSSDDEEPDDHHYIDSSYNRISYNRISYNRIFDDDPESILESYNIAYNVVITRIDDLIDNMKKLNNIVENRDLEDITHIGLRNLFLLNEDKICEDESEFERWYNNILVQKNKTIEILNTRYNKIITSVKYSKVSYEELLKSYICLNFPGFNTTPDMIKNVKRVNSVISNSLIQESDR